jgi:hypothetical protein
LILKLVHGHITEPVENPIVEFGVLFAARSARAKAFQLSLFEKFGPEKYELTLLSICTSYGNNTPNIRQTEPQRLYGEDLLNHAIVKYGIL